MRTFGPKSGAGPGPLAVPPHAAVGVQLGAHATGAPPSIGGVVPLSFVAASEAASPVGAVPPSSAVAAPSLAEPASWSVSVALGVVDPDEPHRLHDPPALLVLACELRRGEGAASRPRLEATNSSQQGARDPTWATKHSPHNKRIATSGCSKPVCQIDWGRWRIQVENGHKGCGGR